MSGDDGWADSADAWITEQGDVGDWGRRYVLDRPMLARIQSRAFRTALDVGCGEGRFCRLLRAEGIAPVGINPTPALLDRARALDPGGDYRPGRAEALADAFGSALGPAFGTFDLVVSYLSLIDIPDMAAGIACMAAALRPGGTLLIANITSFQTAGWPQAWTEDPDGTQRFCIDGYLTERAVWAEWRGIRVRNWHRPLGQYMSALLGAGLILRHFEEPEPQGGDPARAERHRRVPYFHVMEWERPPDTRQLPTLPTSPPAMLGID